MYLLVIEERCDLRLIINLADSEKVEIDEKLEHKMSCYLLCLFCQIFCSITRFSQTDNINWHVAAL